MSYKKPEQKLVSFSYQSSELERVTEECNAGWAFVSLVRNGSYYVGIMEKDANVKTEEASLFIPPRKKIKFSA